MLEVSFHMFEPDKNPIRIAAVILLAILIGIAYILFFVLDWPISISFNIVGITFNLIGTLWIASGVYLFFSEQNHLQKGNPSRNKHNKHIASLLSSASRTIPLGVGCIFIGAVFQIFILVGEQLKWI